ncbi:myosin heavy chain, clone 203 [Hetaerina americana]|uniref:myosin heavy chain, clone 203 n=1 Tax=Hetaerina americana TaxID=62018 RepID=UPI003A7F606F
MRPDKKKRNRGKNADKSDDSLAQSKNVESKVVSEKEAAAKSIAEEPKERSHNDGTSKDKSSTPAKEISNDNVPAPTLKRETDALKETKKPHMRQIFSDWKEYDKPILPEDVEEEQFQDFSSLIQQNISEDNYFKFKHERQWENDTFHLNKDLFSLNLQELSAGLLCIPFYERLNISTDLFSENEIKRMDNISKNQKKIYDGILNSQEYNPVYRLLQKLEIQHVEKLEANDDVMADSIVSQNGTLKLENELLSTCLANEKQNSLDETCLSQPKESKAEECQLQFFQSDNKPVVEDNVCESNVAEIQSQPSPENNVSVMEPIISMNSQINEPEVKHESEENIVESNLEPSDDVAIASEIKESSPMDMETVFESSPLGQRVKPRRSRETKAKTKSKAVCAGDEDKILDSLLSLKEPTITADESKKKEMEEIENEGDNLTNDLKSIVIHEKKENLEDWLDSMLDD